MDTSVFLIRRDEIQERMDRRRFMTVSRGGTLSNRMVPWLLSTGLGLVSGLRPSRGSSYGLVGTLLSAFVLPAVLGYKRDRPEGWIRRILRAVLPAFR